MYVATVWAPGICGLIYSINLIHASGIPMFTKQFLNGMIPAYKIVMAANPEMLNRRSHPKTKLFHCECIRHGVTKSPRTLKLRSGTRRQGNNEQQKARATLADDIIDTSVLKEHSLPVFILKTERIPN